MYESISQYGEQVLATLRTVPETRLVEAARALRDVHERRGAIFVLCPPEDGESVDPLLRELAQGIGEGSFDFRLVQLYGSAGQVVAWQNDWTHENIYAEQMRGVVRRGDAVLAIRQRGEALGVVRALQAARRVGATTIALVGYDGGALSQAADISLHVHPGNAGQAADAQVMLAHVLCSALRKLAGSQPSADAGEP